MPAPIRPADKKLRERLGRDATVFGLFDRELEIKRGDRWILLLGHVKRRGLPLVFFSRDIERDYERVQQLGATISKETFEFPGGKRFHFVDPVGTEFAIWTSSEEE